MKVILSRLPILLLVLYSFTYSIEISKDTVEQTNVYEIKPELFITNNSDTDTIIDSMKIILLSGSIFREIYFGLTVQDTDSNDKSNIVFLHSVLNKENDTTFYLTDIASPNKLKSSMTIPSKKKIRIHRLETGNNLGEQIVTSSIQSLEKTKETPEFDYTVKLTFYQNGEISDYVIIKGFILINSGIMKSNPYSVKPIFDKSSIHYNLLGRSINNISLPLCNNIIVSQNPENRNNFYSRLTK